MFSDGDANTFYFYSFCKNRHNHLNISKIKNSSGSLLTNPKDFKAEAVSFFSHLFTEDHTLDFTNNISNFIPRLVTEYDNLMLDKLPSP